MNDAQKKFVLKAAKDSVSAAVTGAKARPPETDDAQLNEHLGCFVTLKNHGRLRGCLGRFVSDIPLIQLVSTMAAASARQDPRFLFNPITVSELMDLDIEISVLSALRKTKDPLSLRLGVDGIYITKGASSGCFLPQVAEEFGWSKEEFLSNCCRDKAGLAADAWKDGETEVSLFTAEVFGAAFKDI